MGKRLLIIAVIIFFSIPLFSQSIRRSLLNAGSCFYKHKVYAFGYEQRKDQLVFRCFSYSEKLQLKDSTELALGKHTPQHYLEISRDTTHDVLNFYFQLADQKNRVTLCRLDSALKTICVVPDYDANHINSLTAFGDEHYIYKNDLYIITSKEDTTGNQFYISKFVVKAFDKPFEYDARWQYAFERKYIQRASVIYADSSEVIIYALVSEGLKKGEWILRLNSKTGTLKKGTKLNSKGDERHYLYSAALYHAEDRSIDLAGSIYPTNMIDFKNQTSDFKNLSALHQLFIIKMDSLGEVFTRFEKPLPIPAQEKTASAQASLHFKIRSFDQLPDKSYVIWADLYEQKQPNVMSYYSSWKLQVTPVEESFTIRPSALYALSKIIPDLVSFTAGDTYGKIYLKNAGEYAKFKYTMPPNDIVLKAATDDTNNPFYVFRKLNILTGQKRFNYVFTGKKGAENKILLNTVKGQDAAAYFTGKTSYILFATNNGNNEFELKLNSL